MPLESAQFISQLNPANPLSTDSVSQSDDHLRTIKLALKNTFGNLDGPVTATPDQLNYPVPKGAILMWSGLVVNIPAGYGLCDGTQGTPDLRGKFVMGAGDIGFANQPKDTGGSARTSMDGAHTHTINNASAGTPGVTTGPVQAGTGATVVTGVTAPPAHTHTANQVGDHDHAALPPFMALCFIQKL